jgi:hypothetical protein
MLSSSPSSLGRAVGFILLLVDLPPLDDPSSGKVGGSRVSHVRDKGNSFIISVSIEANVVSASAALDLLRDSALAHTSEFG